MPKLTRSQYIKFAREFMHDWENKIDSYHALTLARQINEWKRIGKMFDELIKTLSEQSNLSANQIFKLAEYKKFITVAEQQMNKYALFNSKITTTAQKDFAQSGLTVSNTLLSKISTNFSRLPTESINRAIGITSDGSPLYQLFQKRFGERVDIASNILVDGIAKGNNPLRIAQEMRKQLDISVYDSNRILRTESLNIYRDVSYNSYVESGIVDGWLWLAEKDACEVCLAVEDGNPYPLDVIPESQHPFDRCGVAPNVS